MARWCEHRGEAHFRLGNLSQSLHMGGRALADLGFGVPGSTIGWVGALFAQLGLRIIQRLMPGRFRVEKEADKQRRLHATRIQNRLTEIFIYREDAAGCLASGLRELNLAEPVGPTGDLGRAYAVLSVVLGAVPLHGLGRA